MQRIKKSILYPIVYCIALSCSPKYRGDKRLLGEWQPQTAGMRDILFNSSRYYILTQDSAGRTAYAFKYRVVSNRIVTSAIRNKSGGQTLYQEEKILKLKEDTLVLRNEANQVVTTYVRKRKRVGRL